jgi:hypothetical protein
MCQMGHGHGHGQGHGHHHGHGGGQGHHGCCTFGGRSHHGCCCCGGMQPGCCTSVGWRRFTSPAEEIERLEHYLDELKKEMAGVEARLKELRG